MSEKVDTGGCAFSATMTLLDYMAGQALAGLLTNATRSCDDTAKAAYDQAEAMISEKRRREAVTQ